MKKNISDEMYSWILLVNNYEMRFFCNIQNNQGRVRGYQPKPKAEPANNPYQDLDFSRYHKNQIK